MAKIKDQSLYFIAVIPPDPIFQDAQELKEHFASVYDSKASLNSPPHITLHMPFKLSDKKVEKLIKTLSDLSTEHGSFELEFNGFKAFQPRVIFMSVTKQERLNRLQKSVQTAMKTKLNVFNANYQERPFHPHLTLAFRDLKKDKFEVAWQEFKEKKYHKTFMVKNFCLLKHDGKRWEVFQSFFLG